MKIPEEFSRRICAFFLAATIVGLTGCSTVGLPDQKTTASIQNNKKTLLLVRVAYSGDNAKKARATSDFSVSLWRLSDVDGRVEAIPRQSSLSFKGLSDATVEQGWGYVLVEPGMYCVEIIPAGGMLIENDRRPVFYLPVPAGKSVLYAGTVIFDRNLVKFGHGLSASTDTEFTLTGFQDETEMAKRTLGKELARFGDIEPDLFMSYDAPAIKQPVGVAKNNLNSKGGSVAGVNGDNWRSASLAAAPFALPGLFLLEGARSGSGDGSVYAVGAGVALFVVAAPIAMTTYAITADVHRKRWAPYEAALQKEVAEFGFNERLQGELAARLGNGAVANQTNAWVQVLPYRIVLRGDEDQNFGLEIAVRVRLVDGASGKAIWEHNYMSRAGAPNVSFGTVETSVPSPFGLHRLEDFRGDAGAELFRSELSSAVDELSQEISGRI